MLAERMISNVIKLISKGQMAMSPTTETHLPEAKPGQKYMLYLHVPFCQNLCPYCSYNRYPLCEDSGARYYESLRKEMLMLKDLGYDFETMTFGGGTPTVMFDEFCETVDVARANFSIKEVSTETNPNHLDTPYLEKMKGRVDRLSVGVQSFDDDLLKQMDRYDAYGSGEQNLERLREASTYYDNLSVDMIFNFPAQSDQSLLEDIQKLIDSDCGQLTYHSLHSSKATERKMRETFGKVDFNREYHLYQLLDSALADGDDAAFKRRTVWTYNRMDEQGNDTYELILDDPGVAFDEYPALGCGAISHLGDKLYVNNFSVNGYCQAIERGHMSLIGQTSITAGNSMKVRLMRSLYDLHLDKKAFKEEFGVSVERGLAVELAFLRMNKAFEIDDENELTLTPIGRYLASVIYRQYCISLNSLREQARGTLEGEESELSFGS